MFAQALIDVSPSPQIEQDSPISLSFDGIVATSNDIRIRSQFFGEVIGTWDGLGSTNLVFTPAMPWTIGDEVTVQSGLNAATTRVQGAFNESVSINLNWSSDAFWSNDTVPLNGATLGDFNGDGTIDILGYYAVQWSSTPPGTLKLALGSGDGSFGPFNEVASGLDMPSNMYPSDLDLDGDLDLVLMSIGAQPMSWFLNDGDGNFTYGGFKSGTYWYSKLVDLDGDGDDDLVTSNQSYVYLYRNDFDQGGDFSLVNGLGTGLNYTYGINAGDFDGDGDMDLCASSLGFAPGNIDEKWVWFEFTGSMYSGWVEHTIASDPAGNLPNVDRFEVGDMDGDGDIDLVAQNGAVLLLNDGAGSFTTSSWAPFDFSAHVLNDVDGDGDLDILASRFNYFTYLYRNDGAANFTEFQLATDFGGGVVHASDFNNDGLTDVFVNNFKYDINGTVIYQLLPQGGSILNIDVPGAEGIEVTAQSPTPIGTVTQQGVVLSVDSNPTVSDTLVASTTLDAGEFAVTLPTLQGQTTYHIRSFVVVDGTPHYGPAYSFTTPIQLSYAVGDVGPAGGIVFFVDELDTIPGFDYLELAPQSIEVERVWGCQGNPNPMAFPNEASIGTAELDGLGEGELATSMIVNGCDEVPIAAAYADSIYLVKDGALYDDWYLPSIGELGQLYESIQPLTAIWDTLNLYPAPPEFVPYSFWSSTEWYNTGQAQYWSPMYANFMSALAKSQVAKVRPIRAFSEEPAFGASEPLPLVALAMPDTVVCAGAESIAIDLSTYFTHPTEALSYSISGGPAGAEWSASVDGSTLTIDFSGVGDDAQANVTVTAADGNGDEISQEFSVTEHAGLSISGTVSNVTELGGSDGSIDASANGASLTWSWNNGASTEDLNSLSAGTYVATVTDGITGCQATETFVVSQPGQLELVGTWQVQAASSAAGTDGTLFGAFINGNGLRTVTLRSGLGTFDLDFAAAENFSVSLPAGEYFILGYSDAGGSSTVFPVPFRVVIPYAGCN